MRATWLATAISLGALAEGKLGVATRQFQATSHPKPIRGVNIGGWLVAEEWITPSLFSGGTVDEWTLCASLGKSSCRSRLEDHWQSFFTFDDFVDIRNAGLNSVRIPLGYWAVDVQDSEPYVSGQYPYLIQAVQWARSLDLTVLIDLHGAPGSQNGYDHSGRIGPVGFADNSTNEDRTIAVIRNLTAEFTQDIYGGAVKSELNLKITCDMLAHLSSGIQLLNEPRLTDPTFTMDYLKQFYAEGIETALSVNRSQVNVTIHDAFWGPNYWSNYDPSNENARRPASNIVLDTHQYYAFEPNDNLPHEEILQRICDMSQELKSTRGNLLPQIVGEWSLESGRPPNSSRPSYGDTQAQRTWYRLFFEAQLAAYTPNGPGQPILGFYFWTWKTQYEIDTWSYRRGVAQQYIPSDISNSSTYVFPILENGCVDAGFNYTAPRRPGNGGQRAVAFSPLILVMLGVCATMGAWAVNG